MKKLILFEKISLTLHKTVQYTVYCSKIYEYTVEVSAATGYTNL